MHDERELTQLDIKFENEIRSFAFLKMKLYSLL